MSQLQLLVNGENKEATFKFIPLSNSAHSPPRRWTVKIDSSRRGAIHRRFDLMDCVAYQIVDRVDRLGANPSRRHVAD